METPAAGQLTSEYLSVPTFSSSSMRTVPDSFELVPGFIPVCPSLTRLGVGPAVRDRP